MVVDYFWEKPIVALSVAFVLALFLSFYLVRKNKYRKFEVIIAWLVTCLLVLAVTVVFNIWPRTARIHGIVYNSQKTPLVVDVTISFEDEKSTKRTDEHGNYEFEIPIRKYFELEVEGMGDSIKDEILSPFFGRRTYNITISATATTIPTNPPTAINTPNPTPEIVAILTYHSKFVTAYDHAQDWDVRGEAEAISDCEKFTIIRQNSDRIALETCHGRFVTAPNEIKGPAANWLLKSEPGLNECGLFKQIPLGADKYALITCVDRYVTAMDEKDDITGYAWNWTLRAETKARYDWETFTLINIQE